MDITVVDRKGARALASTIVDRRGVPRPEREDMHTVLTKMDHVFDILVKAFSKGPKALKEVNTLKLELDRLEERMITLQGY